MAARKTADSRGQTAPAQAAETCQVDDCKRKPTVRGLCDAHWASRRGHALPKGKD